MYYMLVCFSEYAMVFTRGKTTSEATQTHTCTGEFVLWGSVFIRTAIASSMWYNLPKSLVYRASNMNIIALMVDWAPSPIHYHRARTDKAYYFLHNTSVLSFYIDVVLTPSIDMGDIVYKLSLSTTCHVLLTHKSHSLWQHQIWIILPKSCDTVQCGAFPSK